MKDIIKEKKEGYFSSSLYKYFLIISALGIAGALLALLLSRGELLKYIIWNGDTIGLYPDFFESVKDAVTRRPYETQGIYPAFAYLICYVVNLFIRNPEGLEWWDLSLTPQACTVMFFLYAFLVLAISETIEKAYKGKVFEQKYLLVFFWLSSPVIYMVERGNMIIFSLLFLLWFYLFYDSDNNMLRWFALICLGMSAALKLYPAIMGLILIIHKKYKEAIKAIIIGVTIFVVPFFFMGGIQSIGGMIRNIVSLSIETLEDSRNFGYGLKVNTKSVLLAISDYLGIKGKNIEMIASISSILVVLLLVVVAFRVKEGWKKWAALCLILTLMPTFSWIYNVVYMIIPLIEFLNQEKSTAGKIKYVYLLFFIGIFIPLPYGQIMNKLPGENKMTFCTVVCSVSMIFMAVCLILDGLMQSRKSVKE